MGVLCLGIHGTWRAEGAGAGAGVGICVLVRAPVVPVFKDLSGAGEYASNGLFGLRSMGDPGLFRGVF